MSKKVYGILIFIYKEKIKNMLITKRVKIKINNINKKHYLKYYDKLQLNQIIDIDIDKVSIGSHVLVDVKCDMCGVLKQMMYKTYIRYLKNNDNKYFCNTCNLDRRKNTMKIRYGVEFAMQSEEFKSKINETNIEKYGTKWALQNDKIKEKLYTTNKLKYGTKCASQNKIVRQKQILSRIKRIIQKYTNFTFLDYNHNTHLIKFECDKGHIFEINRTTLYNRYIYETTLCTVCNPIGFQYSDVENKLLNFIKENYSGQIIQNSLDIIKPLQLDIYLPDLNLAFEFNGIYWHSEIYKDKNYHLNKSEKCLEKRIQLIHVWENDWKSKQEIVKSIILNKLNKTPNKRYARKCKIKEIVNNKLIKNFLNENHIEGYIGSSIKLGLFYNDELVSLMIFKKSSNKWKILRFCNKLNFIIIGGSNKLLNYFINNYKPKNIETIVNRNYFNGNVFKKLNFDIVNKSKPNIYIINKNKIFDSGNIIFNKNF